MVDINHYQIMKYFCFFIIIICLFFALFCFAQGIPEETKTIWEWIKDIWYSYIYPWLQNIWQKISTFLGKQVEKKKFEIQEEWEKEKQEMKEEIPKASKTIWQRFKELIF